VTVAPTDVRRIDPAAAPAPAGAHERACVVCRATKDLAVHLEVSDELGVVHRPRLCGRCRDVVAAAREGNA
jgi:hypothetical protein